MGKQFQPEKHVDRLASGDKPFAKPITGKDNPIRPIDMSNSNFMPKKHTPSAVAKYVCQVGSCSGMDLSGKKTLKDPNNREEE
jgi:hypothetical protein